MVSAWQAEVGRRRRAIAEREAANLELRRRTSLAESTVTHQLNQIDTEQQFIATRDSSLATAHVHFIGRKKPIDYAKYIGFRIQNFYLWHLVHQFNNFTQSLLKVEEELIERMTLIEKELSPNSPNYQVVTSSAHTNRVVALLKLIEGIDPAETSLVGGFASPPYDHRRNIAKDRSTLIIHNRDLDTTALHRPWIFFERVVTPTIDTQGHVIDATTRNATDLALEIEKRYYDRSLARVILEESIFDPDDLVWLLSRIRNKVKIGGEVMFVIEKSKYVISPNSAIATLTYFGFNEAKVAAEDEWFSTVSANINKEPTDK